MIQTSLSGRSDLSTGNSESHRYHGDRRPPSLCDTGSNTDIDIHRDDTVMATNNYGHSSDGHKATHRV